MKKTGGKIRGGKSILLAAFIVVAAVLGALMMFKYLERHEQPRVPVQPKPTGNITVSLFFTSTETGDFIRESREIEAQGGDVAACIRETIEELASGPLGDLSPTLPETCTVRSVQILGDTAVVDLDKGIVEDLPKGSSAEMTAVYSIVNTVCYNFPSVKKVKLMVEGHDITTLGGHLDLKKPLEPNFQAQGETSPGDHPK